MIYTNFDIKRILEFFNSIIKKKIIVDDISISQKN